MTVNVPALAGGQTYWVQFTAHAAGQLSPRPGTSRYRAVGSAAAVPRQPVHRARRPGLDRCEGRFIAKQVTSNTANFSITTAPTKEAAGTYTVQFFNAQQLVRRHDRHDHLHQRRRERLPGEPGRRARHP